MSGTGLQRITPLGRGESLPASANVGAFRQAAAARKPAPSPAQVPPEVADVLRRLLRLRRAEQRVTAALAGRQLVVVRDEVLWLVIEGHLAGRPVRIEDCVEALAANAAHATVRRAIEHLIETQRVALAPPAPGVRGRRLVMTAALMERAARATAAWRGANEESRVAGPVA